MWNRYLSAHDPSTTIICFHHRGQMEKEDIVPTIHEIGTGFYLVLHYSSSDLSDGVSPFVPTWFHLQVIGIWNQLNFYVRQAVKRSKSFFLRYICKLSRWIPPRFPHQFVLISLDNDQLSVILIATITASDIRSDSDGVSIVLIISLPTSRSNADTASLNCDRYISFISEDR
jgi:hypothetical protein